MSIREVLSDNRTVALPFPLGVQINGMQGGGGAAGQGGDLLFWDAIKLVCNAAGNRADQGSLTANQRDFAVNFMGVAADTQLAAETSLNRKYLVSLDGIYDCTCPSQAWEVGDLIAIDRNAAVPANYSGQVNKTSNPALAIGSCVLRTAGVSVTTVRVRLVSNSAYFCDDFAANKFTGGQGTGATILADGAVTLTAASTAYLSMIPTAGRTVTLPLETICAGLEFRFTNNSLGAFSVTFVSSAGLAIKGNGAVPQNKMAILSCDGTNWNGLVSA